MLSFRSRESNCPVLCVNNRNLSKTAILLAVTDSFVKITVTSELKLNDSRSLLHHCCHTGLTRTCSVLYRDLHVESRLVHRTNQEATSRMYQAQRCCCWTTRGLSPHAHHSTCAGRQETIFLINRTPARLEHSRAHRQTRGTLTHHHHGTVYSSTRVCGTNYTAPSHNTADHRRRAGAC